MNCETGELGPSPRLTKGDRERFSHENLSQGAITAESSSNQQARQLLESIQQFTSRGDPNSARNQRASSNQQPSTNLFRRGSFEKWQARQKLKNFLFAPLSLASLATSRTGSNPSLAKDPQSHFDFDELTAEVVGGSNCYLITAISYQLSNEGGADQKFEDGFRQYSMGPQQRLSSSCGPNTRICFIAPGAYWEHRNNGTRKQRPSNATYLNGGPTPCQPTRAWLALFKGSSQLHYTTEA